MAQIQFILGRSGTGKTSWCVDAAAAALRAEGAEPLVLLVPEQATYQMEHLVLSRPGVAGYSQLRVLSFNRLMFWLDRRPNAGAELSRLGCQMATQRVLLELAESLSLYRNAARQPGLAARLSGLLTELQQADCGPGQVAELATQLAEKDAGSTASRKWQDIAKVFDAYAAFFAESAGRLQNPDTQLTQVRRDIARADFLRGAHVWVDGFSGFTVQERELLIELARHAKRVQIALCLDPAAFDLNTTDPNLLDPAGLFYSTEQTYAELLGIFNKCKFTIEPPVILTPLRRFTKAPALGYIEANLLNEQAEPIAAGGAIEIVACTDARAEAQWVAAQVCQLVRGKGYRYRQIAVAVPQMDAYASYFESAFNRYNIPYFLDRPATMRHHPLAETLQAALAAAEGFATADVLCYLKSGLAGIAPQQIEQLERYCLKYGIDGTDWTDQAPWQFNLEQPDENAAMETLRHMVAMPLQELHAALFKQESLEAPVFVQALWRLLNRLNTQQTLSRWVQDDPADTQGHRQTWAQLIRTLDELERVFAGRAETPNIFVSVLTDALTSLTIKLIPPTLDQVLVGAIERSRHPDIRAMFLVGATQKQFPLPLSTTDILGRRERQAAQAQGLELADTLAQQISKRQYLAYIALTRASEYLAISFPQQDEKGAAHTPSIWAERVESLFTDVNLAAGQRRRTLWQSQHGAELAEQLAAACGKDRSPQDDTNAAAYLLCAAMQSSAKPIQAAADRTLRALQYENRAQLAADAVLTKIRGISDFSASRLGMFAACPYQHFAKYVLGLEERPLLRFEPVDVGLFYHKVLETLFARLRDRGLSWGTAAAEELTALLEATLTDTLTNDPTIAAFMRRQLHPRFIIESACQALRQFVPALAELEKAGSFSQVGSEYEFRFELSKGIFLRGRIDRVDRADIDGRKAAVIFDYKRTSRSPDWTKFYHGLDVQLMMYLLAIGSLPKELAVETIAGAFYVPIELSGKTLSPDAVDDQRQAFAYKAKGIFSGDFADRLDKSAPGHSRYYNFAVDKDGRPYSYYSRSGALKTEDFNALLSYARQIIGHLAQQIHTGTIIATPYRIGKTSPCSYCDFKPVCRFDWQINDYNILEGCNKEQALEKMKGSNS